MHLIPPSLLQGLHDYLMIRPMGEVEPLVTALRQCKPVPAAAALGSGHPVSAAEDQQVQK